MAGVGVGVGRRIHWIGVMDTGLVGILSGVRVAGTMVTVGDNAGGVEFLATGWVDGNVGLFFLMDKVAEGSDITRLRDALPAVVRRWTGTRS